MLHYACVIQGHCMTRKFYISYSVSGSITLMVHIALILLTVMKLGATHHYKIALFFLAIHKLCKGLSIECIIMALASLWIKSIRTFPSVETRLTLSSECLRAVSN